MELTKEEITVLRVMADKRIIGKKHKRIETVIYSIALPPHLKGKGMKKAINRLIRNSRN